MSGMLPRGWTVTNLDNVVIYGKGKKPKVLATEANKGMVPYINIKAFKKGIIDEFADVSSSKLIDEDDILVVWDGARFGLTGMGMKGAAGSTLMVLKPIITLPKYIFNFINKNYNLINSKPKGTGTPHVNPAIFWKLLCPLPPLNEQKRIVAKLDKIIPRIETVKERLDNIPTIIKRFRQSILTAAVTGKLTKKWREKHPEVENTQVIGNKIQASLRHAEFVEIWNSFDIPSRWKCFYLHQISELRLGKMLDASKNSGNKVNYLRNKNVRWFSFELDDLKQLRISNNELRKLLVQNGDVFVCEGGEPGRAAVWNGGNEPVVFQKALHRVRFTIPMIADWLVFNLKNDADSQKLTELFTGTTIKLFTGRSLKTYPISIPPLEEQQEIVRQVNKLFTIADKLEAHYQQAKVKANKLSQSILAKAFWGELVPQDPNDEPAEKLLERIQREKAKLEADTKKPRRKTAKTRRKQIQKSVSI